MRRWSPRGAAILLGVALVAAGGMPALSQASLGTVTAASVSPHWSVTLPVVVAQQKGYWRNEGLDVRFTVVSPGSAHVAAFAGGRFQFTVNLNSDVFARAAAQGARIYAIMGSTNQNQYALFGRSGIKTLQDLKGKRIAIDNPGGSHDVFIQEIVSSVGISIRDVTLIPVSGTIEVRVNAMLAGATDAAIGSVSQWPTLRPQGVNLILRLHDFYPDWQTAVNGATGEILDKNPAAARAFIKGFIRAFQFLKDPRNDAEALRIAKAARLEVDEKSWSEGLAIQRDFWPADGGLNLKGTEIVLLRERDAGRIPKDYTLAKFVRIGPLAAAQRELGLRR